MFVHHVFFWFNPGNDDKRDYFVAQLKELSTIDLVRESRIGVPAPSERDVVDSSFDYSLMMIFDNQADQDAYQVHPDHDVFIANCKDLWARVQVYDAIDV
ncbi:MAG: Dabb family protein [Bacteroidota bacterium]